LGNVKAAAEFLERYNVNYAAPNVVLIEEFDTGDAAVRVVATYLNSGDYLGDGGVKVNSQLLEECQCW
jgi:hypothetical protein